MPNPWSLTKTIFTKITNKLYSSRRLRSFLHNNMSEVNMQYMLKAILANKSQLLIDAAVAHNALQVIETVLANNSKQVIEIALGTSPQQLIDIAASTHHEMMLNTLGKQLTSLEHSLLPSLTLLASAAHGSLHYSQEGEDIVLNRYLLGMTTGFFVDVGAHHPIRFSNTYSLYCQGWRGVNIDATPGSMNEFKSIRPEDFNIEAAVSDKNEELAFHLFKEPALNTFNAALAESYISNGWERLEIKNITTQRLEDILDEVVPQGTTIDLMSIDAEGLEMAVLLSNNWDKYSPDCIIMEVLDTKLSELCKCPPVAFIMEKGYYLVSKLVQSAIFVKKCKTD